MRFFNSMQKILCTHSTKHDQRIRQCFAFENRNISEYLMLKIEEKKRVIRLKHVPVITDNR